MPGPTGHIDRNQLASYYGDHELAEAIYADAVSRGNLRKILKGELHWPERQDAVGWRDRIRNEKQRAEDEAKRHADESKPLPGEPGYQEEDPNGLRDPGV